MVLENKELKFNEDGLLPQGCHEVTLDKIKKIFVDDFPDSETRLSRYNCFIKMYQELLDNVKSCRCVFIDGSFVTNEINPYDVDFLIVIEGSNLTENEADYINNILSCKKDLRREYDYCKEKVTQGEIHSSELYKLKFYEYGCDFFIILKYDEFHALYNQYLKEKKYWTEFWGTTRDKKFKGFLNLIVNYEDDLNGL